MKPVAASAEAPSGRGWRDAAGMRRALLISIPFLVAIPVLYGIGFALAGQPVMLGAFAVGVVGWIVALILRTPVGVAAMQVTASEERAQTWVTASSGPLEEAVRLGALLFAGRDLSTALWLGLGWASIEVVYALVNGFALAALAQRTDPEAQRARALLPPSAFTSAGVVWGVVERAWATAVHIGFTLILAAVPLAIVITAPAHSVLNFGFLWAGRRYPIAAVSVAGVVVGAALFVIGLVLMA